MIKSLASKIVGGPLTKIGSPLLSNSPIQISECIKTTPLAFSTFSPVPAVPSMTISLSVLIDEFMMSTPAKF